jgi:hypothetical protein
MTPKPLEVIEEHFRQVKDPRMDRTKDHKRIDILVIAICAIICGAEGWVDIELYDKNKLHWLKTFLNLPNGIPSYYDRHYHDLFFSDIFSHSEQQSNPDKVFFSDKRFQNA